MTTPGGLQAPANSDRPRTRQIVLLQRKTERLGGLLGKSTGWILKLKLQTAAVAMIGGVIYNAIDDFGLHVTIDGMPELISADTIITCAGQDSDRRLYNELTQLGISAHLIGGAHTAAELDAVAAIEQATRLALQV